MYYYCNQFHYSHQLLHFYNYSYQFYYFVFIYFIILNDSYLIIFHMKHNLASQRRHQQAVRHRTLN